LAVTRGTLQIARRLRRDIGAEVDTVVRDLTGAWVRAWDGQASLWTGAAADLVAEAGRLDHWPRPTDIARLPRAIEALDRAETTLTGLAEYTARQTVPAAGRLVDLDVEREPALIASQAPAAERAALLAHVGGRLAVAEQQDQDTVRLTVLSRIRTDAVEVIRRRAAGQVTSDLLPLSGEALDAIRRELIRGVDVGDNPRTAAARMLAAVEGRFNGGLTRALTIARTEMLDAYRATSQQIHTANADVVPAWQWLAELDSRVCISCVVMHGQQFPAATPGPDDHAQGRCARIPVLTPWAELGISAPEPPSVMPDAQAWFDGLPEAQQLQIAGPARLALLRGGRVRWGDLSTVRQNPGWRPSRVPTPVRDLRRAAADPTRPPPATPAPPAAFTARSARRPGEDISGYARQELPTLAGRAATQTGYGDKMLTELTRRQTGWHQPAQVVAAAELDQALAAGWTQVWRGVQDPFSVERTRQIAESVRAGDWRMGGGLYGNGVYTSTRRTTGEAYRGGVPLAGQGRWDARTGEWVGQFGYSQPGGLMRMAVDPDARIADYHQLHNEHHAWYQAEVDRERGTADPDASWLEAASDLGWYAVMRGYDGIRIRSGGAGDGASYPPGISSEADQYVIFNRSVLMIEEASGRYDP
jgi:hypothetical protein